MITKTIYQVAINLNYSHPGVQEQIKKTLTLNPGWKYKIITKEEQMDQFVNENYPGSIADAYNRLNILVAKVDFWRYLNLYKHGGVYLDMDSSIDKPLDQLIKEEDDAIITAEGNPDFYVQWALIYGKDHPILKRLIDLIVDNIKHNKYPNDIHKMTGPTVYSKAINEIHNELFHENLIHRQINRETDVTYKKDNIIYRIYGIDYSGFFGFKYPASRFLYNNTVHWSIEQKHKPLLKPI